MEKEYIDLLNSFVELNTDDKKQEIIDNLIELLKLLYKVNKSMDLNNVMLPIYAKDIEEDDYLNQMYSLIISLKEENAKVIEKLNLY